jgi:hypothetical protein
MERDLGPARVLACVAGRSLPIRATTRLSQLHPNPIGLAPIRRAGDGRLQAIAYGRLGGPPMVVTLVDPLSRTDPGLDHLGTFLTQALLQPLGPQVWIPDEASFLALCIEALRSRTNPHCSPLRQQLGRCLHALARLEPLAGQQVVAIATDVLAAHLITGQSPTEDALHLGARLAWDDPQPDRSAVQVAAQHLHHPGPSLLPLHEDEQVETLRARLRTGRGSTRDRDEILHILTGAASDSWELLVQAWRVFQRLPLPALPGLEALEADSQQELTWLLGGAPTFTHHLGRAYAEFSQREFWRARLEDLEARGDPIMREVLRREGRVIEATTLRHQDRWLVLGTTQPVLRLRSGTRLTSEDGRIGAVVATLHARTGTTVLLAHVTRGIRVAATLPVGSTQDWFDTGVFRGRTAGGSAITRLVGIPPAEGCRPCPCRLIWCALPTVCASDEAGSGPGSCPGSGPAPAP